MTASPSVRSRQLWRRSGNFLKTFLQLYVYDLRFKAAGLTTFWLEFWTLMGDMTRRTRLTGVEGKSTGAFTPSPEVCSRRQLMGPRGIWPHVLMRLETTPHRKACSALTITPSHQQKYAWFCWWTQKYEWYLYYNHVCSASHMRPGRHFQNV